MTIESQSPLDATPSAATFGARLQSAREALGMDRKEIAAKLRLNEKIIVMMETEQYPPDLPITFIRGYLRAYGKILEMTETEMHTALAQLQVQPRGTTRVPNTTVPILPASQDKYVVRLFSLLALSAVIGLTGVWWYSHTILPTPIAGMQATLNMTAPQVAQNKSISDTDLGTQSLAKLEHAPTALENEVGSETPESRINIAKVDSLAKSSEDETAFAYND